MLALMKLRLSVLVVFSGAFGYLMGTSGAVEMWRVLTFSAGSLLITGAANTINQILERHTDLLMKRTAKRPLPTNAMSVAEASGFAFCCAIAGVGLVLYSSNLLAAALGLLSLLLYAFVYTPLKPITSFSVLVGAFPGALPPLIGWAAATGTLGAGGWVLFALQFIWQFPHFWAIAWRSADDYQKAGLKMLPSAGGKDNFTALQMVIYCSLLLPLGLLPAAYAIASTAATVVLTVANLAYLASCLWFYTRQTDKNALWVMLASFFYLPVIQLALIFDKV